MPRLTRRTEEDVGVKEEEEEKRKPTRIGEVRRRRIRRREVEYRPRDERPEKYGVPAETKIVTEKTAERLKIEGERVRGHAKLEEARIELEKARLEEEEARAAEILAHPERYRHEEWERYKESWEAYQEKAQAYIQKGGEYLTQVAGYFPGLEYLSGVRLAGREAQLTRARMGKAITGDLEDIKIEGFSVAKPADIRTLGLDIKTRRLKGRFIPQLKALTKLEKGEIIQAYKLGEETRYYLAVSPFELSEEQWKLLVKAGFRFPKELKQMIALKEKGLITEKEFDYLGHVIGFELAKSVEVLTSKEVEQLTTAGFKVPDLPAGPSWKLYQWGETTFKEGTREGRVVELYAAITGQFIKSLTDPYRFIAKLIPGKQGPLETGWKAVTPKTIEELEELSPGERRLYDVMGTGAAYLGSFVAYIPVGVAVSAGVSPAISLVTSKLDLALPATLERVAQYVAAHPKATQALLYGASAAPEVVFAYKKWKAGEPVGEVFRETGIKMAEIAGSIKGLEVGYEIPSKIKGWWETRGKTLIPPEELWTEYSLGAEPYPMYKGPLKGALKEYKGLAERKTAEEFLGEVPEDLLRQWHVPKEPWPYKVGEITEIQVGDISRIREFPGLYLSAEPSPLRLPKTAGYGVKETLALPKIKTYEIVSVDAKVKQMIAGMGKAQTEAWFLAQAGKGVSFIPTKPWLITEMEAIVPATSKAQKVAAEWYTKWAGKRVLVSKYKLLKELGAEGARAAETVELGALLASLTTLGEKEVYPAVSFASLSRMIYGSTKGLRTTTTFGTYTAPTLPSVPSLPSLPSIPSMPSMPKTTPPSKLSPPSLPTTIKVPSTPPMPTAIPTPSITPPSIPSIKLPPSYPTPTYPPEYPRYPSPPTTPPYTPPTKPPPPLIWRKGKGKKRADLLELLWGEERIYRVAEIGELAGLKKIGKKLKRDLKKIGI